MLRARRWPAPLAVLAAAGAQLSTAPPSPGRLPPEPRARYRRPQAALAPAIGSTGAGAASATCAPARFLMHPQTAFYPQLPPSRGGGEGGAQPTPGALEAQLWEFLVVTTPRPSLKALGDLGTEA